MTATLDEIRELSRRSLRTYRVTLAAMLGMLVLVAWTTRSPLATLAGGALLVATAYASGRERGAYRRILRRARKERSAR